jgi:hypothetical protein
MPLAEFRVVGMVRESSKGYYGDLAGYKSAFSPDTCQSTYCVHSWL